METRFELTFEDFAEALNAAQLEKRQTGFQVRTSRYTLLVLLLGVFGFVVALLWLTYDPREGFNFDTDDIADFAVSMGPWIVLGVLFIVQSQSIHMSRRTTIVWLIVVGLLICVLATIGAFTGRRASGYTFFSWAVVIVWWWGFWQALIINTSHRAIWRKATNYHGPKLLTWTAEGFSISDEISEVSFKWTAVRGWQETYSLVLLWISEHGFFIIPKRAFADQASWQELCRIAALATDKNKPPAAFPVILLESTSERK
jgi:hypothetical protein